MQQASLDQFFVRWLPPLEDEMRSVLSSEEPALFTHYGMMQYHMGWRDESLAVNSLPVRQAPASNVVPHGLCRRRR